MLRILELCLEDDSLALAADEAVLRSRYAGIAPDTLHIWSGHKSVLFTDRMDFWTETGAIKELGLRCLRVNSVEGKAIYCDSRTLNFAIAANQDLLKVERPENVAVLSEYQTFFECVAKGLEELGLKARADPKGVYSDNGKISAGFPYWLNKFLLFRACVFIDTELGVPARIITSKEKLTSVSEEIGRKIDNETAKAAILKGFETRLGVKLSPQPLLEKEKSLMGKLHRMKYSTAEWNEKGKEPHLGLLGEKLVEVYVANPPTSKCREFISLVDGAVKKAEEETKVVVWLRGVGDDQHPGEIYSPGLTYVSKAGLLPAVIVNGKVVFSREVPSKEDLEKAVIGGAQ